MKVETPNKNLEEKYYDLHEIYFDRLMKEKDGEIIQSGKALNIILGGEDLSKEIDLS